MANSAFAASGPVWGNTSVEFVFNPGTGTYAIRGKRDGAAIIEAATFQIDSYKSTDDYAFTSKSEPYSDELGKGQKISIEGRNAKKPSLILEVFLYEGKGFVALNLGIDNTDSKEMRIKEFSPLRATAFKGFALEDYKTLDGENSNVLSKVSSQAERSSNNNLLVTFGKKGKVKRSLVIGGLTYNEFRKYASVKRGQDSVEIALRADDPVGKLVDAKSRYILKDKFYLNFTTDNRFDALENYGEALRLADRADVSGGTIPILNLWNAAEPKFGGDGFRNNSVGMVNTMEQIVKGGFLRYSPVGIRLEPDDYSFPSNQQGWWDDKHWQMYAGGQLLAPYETIVKLGTEIQSLGGVPLIYSQTAKRSEDYCLQHPEHMLFNDPLAKRSQGAPFSAWWSDIGDKTGIYWTYDFTDPGFLKHMEDVYKNLKAGGVRGIKFDYPDTGWSYNGGFEDKYATTTSAYRNIFRLAYEGLGDKRDVQERLPYFGDVALGVITTQRTAGDTDRAYPSRVSTTGLRWYKNRMVVNYDHDGINPHHVYPTDSQDGWRAAITITSMTSGRIEVGKYLEKMTGEMIHDLSRAIPLLDSPIRSARPADAFEGKIYPAVYNFTAAPEWNIVTFYNYQIEGETWPEESGAYFENQFIPKKMIPATIGTSMGDRTDDGGLGLDPQKKYYVMDFWNWSFIGRLAGDTRLEQTLRPGETRVMAVHEVQAVPQFISTDRHLLQGFVDMSKKPKWDVAKLELSATSTLAADETYKVIIATNGYVVNGATAVNAKCDLKLYDEANSLYELSLKNTKSGDASWTVTFTKPKASPAR